MNTTRNNFFSKPFLKSFLFTQNKWHQHGVFLHTMRVVYHTIKSGNFKLLPAAILHDIGKPVVAFVEDEEDAIYGEYSFTDHEEISYQIIKNWFFISTYTKSIVRYHYLIRDMKLSKIKDPKRHLQKRTIWETLDDDMKKELEIFLKYDDLGKGKKRR